MNPKHKTKRKKDLIIKTTPKMKMIPNMETPGNYMALAHLPLAILGWCGSSLYNEYL